MACVQTKKPHMHMIIACMAFCISLICSELPPPKIGVAVNVKLFNVCCELNAFIACE